MLGGHAALQTVDLVGRVRAERDDLERVGEPGPKVDVGGQVEQAVDRLDVELVVDQLDHQHHDRSRAADFLARGAQLVAVGARGLEAVVTVGEHDRRAADPGLDFGDAGRVVDRAQLVDHAVGVDAAGEHHVGFELFGEAGREAEAPDRVDVGAASPAGARADPTWPWRPCARGGARSGRRAREA